MPREAAEIIRSFFCRSWEGGRKHAIMRAPTLSPRKSVSTAAFCSTLREEERKSTVFKHAPRALLCLPHLASFRTFIATRPWRGWKEILSARQPRRG